MCRNCRLELETKVIRRFASEDFTIKEKAHGIIGRRFPDGELLRYRK